MSCNRCTVIDKYRAQYQLLCEAIARQGIVDRARLAESARRKLQGKNAMRLCPRLRP
jgi:hypothetical protein